MIGLVEQWIEFDPQLCPCRQFNWLAGRLNPYRLARFIDDYGIFHVDVIMEVNDRAHMVLRPFAPGLPALILRLRTDPVNMRPASRKGSPKRRRTTCVNLKLLRAIGV